MHCGVANESVRSFARGHVIRVCDKTYLDWTHNIVSMQLYNIIN